MTKPAREKTLCLIVFLFCAALNVWFSSVGWNNNLLEGHEFRQTQTALTAHYFRTEGWSLAYPLPLFGPPWSAPMEFPLYQYGAALVSRASGLALEPAGRLVSLCCFYLSLPAFFLLQRLLGVTGPRRWLLLGLLLVSPAYLYYSRSFMIESAALCAAAWFLHAYGRAIESRRFRWILAAALLGGLAAAIKITTFSVFLVPAALLTTPWLLRERGARLRSLLLAGIGSALPAVLIGYAWVHYGDAVKAGSPLGEFLRSGPMNQWNFGTAVQRVSGDTWATILRATTSSTLVASNLFFFLVLGVFAATGPVRWRTLALLACFLSGPLAFINLFVVHDYYFYATGVFLLAGLALAWNRLLDLPGIPTAGGWLAIGLSLVLQIYSYCHSYYHLQADARPAPPELSRVLKAVTAPDDVILIYGLDWNPIVPYYAERKVIMVTTQYALDHERRNQVIGRLPKGRIGALVALGEIRHQAEFFRLLAQSLDLGERPLITSGDTHVYVAERLAAAGRSALTRPIWHEFTLAAPATAAPSGVRQQHYLLAELADQSAFDMMATRPVEVVVPFGLAAAMVDGKRVFNAHAPTQLLLPVPKGTKELRAAYGVLPDAYENGHRLEGIQFLIELVRPNGERSTLSDRFLNPNLVPSDRGTQVAVVTLPADAEGQLVLSALPGPSGSISFAWGYWSEVALK